MSRARSAFTLVEPTEFLSLQADVLVDLSSILAGSGEIEEATSSLEDALSRRTRKDDLVGVERAEELLIRLRAG